MEDLQSTLQSVLSDPAQMAQIAALAESLGLKPPEKGTGQERQEASEAPPSEGGADAAYADDSPPSAFTGPEGLDLGKLTAGLSAMGGSEDRVLGALRPALAPAGRAKADRALRAAKLARLAGQLLGRGREGRV